ncbi:hypothetical protein V6N13_065446 [Hibiscus sabdariffa]
MSLRSPPISHGRCDAPLSLSSSSQSKNFLARSHVPYRSNIREVDTQGGHEGLGLETYPHTYINKGQTQLIIKCPSGPLFSKENGYFPFLQSCLNLGVPGRATVSITRKVHATQFDVDRRVPSLINALGERDRLKQGAYS